MQNEQTEQKQGISLVFGYPTAYIGKEAVKRTHKVRQDDAQQSVRTGYSRVAKFVCSIKNKKIRFFCFL